MFRTSQHHRRMMTSLCSSSTSPLTRRRGRVLRRQAPTHRHLLVLKSGGDSGGVSMLAKNKALPLRAPVLLLGTRVLLTWRAKWSGTHPHLPMPVRSLQLMPEPSQFRRSKHPTMKLSLCTPLTRKSRTKEPLIMRYVTTSQSSAPGKAPGREMIGTARSLLIPPEMGRALAECIYRAMTYQRRQARPGGYGVVSMRSIPAPRRRRRPAVVALPLWRCTYNQSRVPWTQGLPSIKESTHVAAEVGKRTRKRSRRGRTTSHGAISKTPSAVTAPMTITMMQHTATLCRSRKLWRTRVYAAHQQRSAAQ